ncbi:MAG: zinc-ribbon domain-containing protein [Candidatus Heimdallarchaeota archaeon]|nr:zinc-ribbon domain-containing protein [Candidatus Heimdallarchaeota archaeon]MCK4252846.1 zinc-ribbon domain-containing protein [Candidatus Heimdallarchaeota archaeon]
MYCNNCGANLPEGTKFCPNCGADSGVAAQPAKAQPQQANIQYSGTQPYSPPPTPYKPKEPILALILSWFVMLGLGHMYAGKVGKGLGLLAGGFVSGLVMSGGYVILLVFYYNLGLAIALLVIGGISAIVIVLYAHIDAYKTAKKYNLFLEKNGRPPTSNDDW